jgi:hypothetical protein
VKRAGCPGIQPPHMDTRECLGADGLGGFASGTVATVRTRRYHGWLLSARTPPAALI